MGACLILTMNPEQLAHLDRIGGFVDALGSLPWMEAPELEQISLRLLDFDSSRWSFLRVLSFPLYAELTALLASGEALPHLKSRPRIAVVMPVYAPRRDLLRAALESLRGQVGVAIDCLISVDGRVEDRQLVEEVVAELEAAGDDSHWRVSVFLLERDRGVGLCRNRAFQEVTAPFFSCLDADDIFHPLRCLHALLALQSSGVDRLNTGWSRVSLDENKIVLINDRLHCTGQSSFWLVQRSSLAAAIRQVCVISRIRNLCLGKHFLAYPCRIRRLLAIIFIRSPDRTTPPCPACAVRRFIRSSATPISAER